MKGPKPYAELVTQAEQATSAIKDPELRRVAFERVLDDLLAAGGTQKATPRDLKQVKRSAGADTRGKKQGGPKGYVRELVEEGFFKDPKTIAEVKAELANRGHHIALTSLSGPLQQLCGSKERVLRRQKAKADASGKKTTYKYSQW